jgi:hypothetical protein
MENHFFTYTIYDALDYKNKKPLHTWVRSGFLHTSSAVTGHRQVDQVSSFPKSLDEEGLNPKQA